MLRKRQDLTHPACGSPALLAPIKTNSGVDACGPQAIAHPLTNLLGCAFPPILRQDQFGDLTLCILHECY